MSSVTVLSVSKEMMKTVINTAVDLSGCWSSTWCTKHSYIIQLTNLGLNFTGKVKSSLGCAKLTADLLTSG